MKTLIILSILFNTTLSFGIELQNKCEQKKITIESLKKEIQDYSLALIFPLKQKVSNKKEDYIVSNWEAMDKYVFLLKAIEDSFKDSEIYDFTAKINNIHFKSDSSCMKLSRIRKYLQMSNFVLPVIPSKLQKEITIAVIDTGIDLKNFELTKRMVVPNQLNDLDFSETGLQDKHGHGSHVTGLILAVFPFAKILPLKFYNPKASGQKNLESTVAALNYAIDQNVNLINYSGGGPQASVEELRALRRAEKKGILVVAAAGNEKSDIDNKRFAYFPASYQLKNQIVVGNVDKNNNRAPSSNYGKNSVDILALGTNSFSFGLGYACADFMTGTSQATPLVTGALALIMASNPSMTPMEAKNKVIEHSQSIKNLTNVAKNGAVLNFKQIVRR